MLFLLLYASLSENVEKNNLLQKERKNIAVANNNNKNKVAGVFLGIAAFLVLLLLYFALIIVVALVVGLITSLFSDSDTAKGLWWLLFDRHNDGWWIYFVLYLLPFYLSSKVAATIVRNHPIAEKWVFFVFGGLLILIYLPLAIYMLFTGESFIVQVVLCIVGLISIFAGKNS